VKDPIINLMFGELRALNTRFIGNAFPPEGDSIFRQKVMARIEAIELYFEAENISGELLSLIIAHAVRNVFELSPFYLEGKKYLAPDLLQHLTHMLSLIFTPCAQLKKLREEPSYRNLGDFRPVFNHGFHGEFSYALLHILNGHRLYVRPENLKLMFDIAQTTNTIACISEREGSPLGWREASQYGVDPSLSERKQQFCAAIDAREPRRDFDNCVVNKEALGAPVTLALWNRNAEKNRDPNRRLSVKMVQNIVMHVREQSRERALRLLIVGDGGRLPDIEAWAHENGIECHEHRTEHMFPKTTPPLTAPVSKDEQLYLVRNIMKKFNPDLIVGPRSGLVALCELVGCAGLQLDMADASSTKIATRVSRKVLSSNVSAKVSAFDAPYKTRDNRLLEIFARCPIDGLGPHLELVASGPNPDTARINEFSQHILELTIAVMMVVHDDFKPLMLETLASYLSGDAQALQRLSVLLHTYRRLSQAGLKDSAVAEHETFDDSSGAGPGGGARDFYDDKNDKHDGKTGGPTRDNGSGSTSAFHGNRGGFGYDRMHQARLSQYEDKVMDSEAFFSRLEVNKDACKIECLMLKIEDKHALLIYAILNVNLVQFIDFYQSIIPVIERDRLLQQDGFIVFEYALSCPEHLRFLLAELGDNVSDLFVNDYFLRCALQLESHEYVSVVFELLKSKVESRAWSALCTHDEGALVRAIAENMDADYAWKQCATLSSGEKKHVLMGDNYMLFRRAALLESRMMLLEDMQRFLTPEELKLGVNAYGGDIAYQAMIAEDRFFFNYYYPMLDEAAKLDLVHRITTEAPEKLETYAVYRDALQTAPVIPPLHEMTSPPRTPVSSPRESTRRTAASLIVTPASVADFTSPPRSNVDHGDKNDGKQLSQTVRAELAQRSALLFNAGKAVPPMCTGIQEDNDDSLVTEFDGCSSNSVL
jgi:hypothetical protein